MKDSQKLISTQIEKDIPQFIRMEYPNFVAFIVKYYEWMEQEGRPFHFITNILNYADVDRTSLEFLDNFGKAFLAPLPDVIYGQNNIATLIKNINQYYSARGSEKSFEFLFQLFQYKTDPTGDLRIYYPSVDMLRISDGKWVNERSLKIINPPDNVLDWEGGEIVGSTSNAKGVIDEILVYTSTSGVNIAELFLIEFDVIHSPTKFIVGENVNVITKEGVITFFTTANIIQNVVISDPGQYYYENQRANILTSGDGEDGFIITDNVSKGVVDSLYIVNGGAGYEVNDKIYAQSDDFGCGAYGKVLTIDINGVITGVELVYGGHDYSHMPEIKINSINGNGAVIFPISTSIGQVNTVNIRNFGINYQYNNSIIQFNTMLRVYDIVKNFEIGETITGRNSLAVGIIDYINTSNGILSVKVTSGMFSYGETFDGNRYSGNAKIFDLSTAQGIIEDGCVCSYKGRYINKDGHLSSLKYIQDSYFYQMFSYMLRTDRDKSEWKDYVKHVHPAGTIGFSYRDAISKYENESYAGFISPTMDSTEFYKFRWDDSGNTQINQYKDIIIDEISNINNNELNKTKFVFGSEITIT